MSIDTREKRASAIACGLLWLVVPPVPDGSTASPMDRMHLMGLYRLEVVPGAVVEETLGPSSIRELASPRLVELARLIVREQAQVRILEDTR